MEETVRFSPDSVPFLKGGNYRVTIEQSTDISNCQLQPANIDFTVSGPTDYLGPSEVYSVYPPRNATGKYEHCLPHIILHRKTLPWEFSMEQMKDTTPWVGLFVFSEHDDIDELTMTYEDSKKLYSSTVYVPPLTNADLDPKQKCLMIKVQGSLLHDILPTESDLQYLCHTRGVDLDVKPTDPEVNDNWYSCVVANRYPEALSNQRSSLRHKACLVSLLGYEEFIKENGKRETEDFYQKSYYFYCLYQWEFSVEKEEYNFYSLAKKTNADILHLKNSADNAGSPQEIKANQLFQLGYCPVEERFRDGSISVSWYHSPLMPQRPTFDLKQEYYTFSDELLRYDPDCGMFDVSYSAAWQLGRQLGLQFKDFARKLYEWRIDNKDLSLNAISFHELSKHLHCSLAMSGAEPSGSTISSVWEKSCKAMIEACDSATKEQACWHGTGLERYVISNKMVNESNSNHELTQKDLIEREGD